MEANELQLAAEARSAFALASAGHVSAARRQLRDLRQRAESEGMDWQRVTFAGVHASAAQAARWKAARCGT